MRLAEHEIFSQIRIVRTAKTTAIQYWTKRQPVRFDFVRVAETHVGLVLRAYMPAQPLIPLYRVVRTSKVHAVVVVSQSRHAEVRLRVQVDDLLRNGIDLVLANHIVYTVTGKCRRAARIRRIELNRHTLIVEASVQQF